MVGNTHRKVRILDELPLKQTIFKIFLMQTGIEITSYQS